MNINKTAADCWMDNAGRYPLLCETTTLALIRKAQDTSLGERQRRRALDRLCLHNLRLVISAVRRYVDKSNGLTMRSDCIADLYQQGYFGLRRAVEKFDLGKKIRFSTYATIWINQSVNRYKLATASVIRVPEKAMYDVYHWMQTGKQRLQAGPGRGEILSADAQVKALMAMFPSSLDAFTNPDDEGNTVVDCVSEKNSLWQPSHDNSGDIARVKEMLNEAKVEPQVQDLFLDYMRKGNMQMCAYRAKVNYKYARTAIKETLTALQAMA